MIKVVSFIFYISLFQFSNLNAWKGRVFPISFNKKTNQWNVLLTRINKLPWTDFFLNSTTKGQKGNNLAQQALGEQTGGLYNIDLSKTPWFKFNQDIVHILDISGSGKGFISARDIYTQVNKGGGLPKDFVWDSIDNILKDGAVHHKIKGTGKQEMEPIASETFDILKKLDSKLEKNVKNPSPTISDESWLAIPNAIYFYNASEKYYEFTNFYLNAPIFLDNQRWPTTEHYYQAQKFTGRPDLQALILKADTPRQAFNIAKKYAQNIDKDWKKRSLEAMVKAVLAKFSQSKDLENLLLSTDNRILVENAGANDAFYGAGADGKGENHLGQILMYVRSILRNEIDPLKLPYVSHLPSYYINLSKNINVASPSNIKFLTNSFWNFVNGLSYLQSLSK